MGFSYWKRFRQGAEFVGAVRISLLFLAAALVGCKGESGSTSSVEAEHIGKVGGLISEFKSANSGNNPKNIEELKNWAINQGKAEEKDFVSTRDKEQYVIEPMAMMRGGGMGGDMSFMAAKMPVILHEAKGIKGKKYVVQGTTPVGTEMPDEGLNNLTKGRADKNMNPPK
jgi:hypothetical protein